MTRSACFANLSPLTTPDLIRGGLLRAQALAALTLALLGTAAQSQTVAVIPAVPSGHTMTLHEQIIVEPERKILYLGFLAPSIAGNPPLSFETASDDMDMICETIGIKRAGQLISDGDLINEVVVRLMERPVHYGETDSSIRQFINVYDISEGKCLWN